MKILYLSLNPALQGPFPKIDPLLINGMSKLGCQITRLPWGRHSENENFSQKFSGRIKDIIRAFLALIRKRYDIVYVVTTLDERAITRDIPLLLTTFWFPAKKVLIMHGSKTDHFTKQGYIIFKLFTRLLIRLSDAILLLSSEEMEEWNKFEPKGKYFRVDNPFIPNIELTSVGKTSIRQKPFNSPNILFVGRLIKAKGIFDLLNAIPIILRQSDCHLLIAGVGEEKEEIISLIKSANLAEHITLLGYVDSTHLSSLYKSSSILILPTYFGEGFPTVLAEAMSFSLPIITTAIRGARDHLKDGINALFVQPRDPDSIARAVGRLLNEPELRSKMIVANLKKVMEFSPEKVVPRYVQIFLELIGEDVGKR